MVQVYCWLLQVKANRHGLFGSPGMLKQTNKQTSWTKVYSSESFDSCTNCNKGALGFETARKLGKTALLMAIKSWTNHHSCPWGFWMGRNPGQLGLLSLLSGLAWPQALMDRQFRKSFSHIYVNFYSLCTFYSPNVSVRKPTGLWGWVSFCLVWHLSYIGELSSSLPLLYQEHKRSDSGWSGNSKVKSPLKTKYISPFNLERDFYLIN